MNSKRYLVIEKLVISVPDDLQAEDGREEISIDEALAWFLQYRKTQQAAIENKYGNFKYFYSNLPPQTYPDEPATMSSQKLTQYLANREKECAVGMIASLIYDPELGAYRNAYTEDEMKVYHQKMASHRSYLAKMKNPNDAWREVKDCSQCDQICDERCPTEPQVEQQMVEGEEEHED